jgi:hypothetical protein
MASYFIFYWAAEELNVETLSCVLQLFFSYLISMEAALQQAYHLGGV